MLPRLEASVGWYCDEPQLPVISIQFGSLATPTLPLNAQLQAGQAPVSMNICCVCNKFFDCFETLLGLMLPCPKSLTNESMSASDLRQPHFLNRSLPSIPAAGRRFLSMSTHSATAPDRYVNSL